MCQDMLKGLGMSDPDIYLEKFNQSANDYYFYKTNRMSYMTNELYKIFMRYKPSMVFVYGDIDSTLAAAMAAKTSNCKVAHIESGLRSFDDEMPEEINRKIVDSISDFCFVTEQSGIDNLKGCRNKIFFVGNTMIDSLVWMQKEGLLVKENNNKKYIVLTAHRPSNVDDPSQLKNIVSLCENITSRHVDIVWPVHPRTKTNLKKYNLWDLIVDNKKIETLGPMNYIEFIQLVYNSYAVVTDSGGIQEETSFMGIPCYTIRKNTERPVTIDEGTNRLVKLQNNSLSNFITDEINNIRKKTTIPLWDGKASDRIRKIILKNM